MSQSKYHKDYVREDAYASFHISDPDLPDMHLPLPSVESFYGLPWDEAIQKVDGYGLSPKNQHYEKYRDLGYYSMPESLVDIEDVVRKVLAKKDKEKVHVYEIFDYIESDPIKFEDEIKWIEKQHLRAENGTFVFIKGKPTYIDGIHYAYLLCWRIYNTKRKDTIPFYRDIDRKIFIFFRWAYTTKSAFYKYVIYYKDNKGNYQPKFFNHKRSAHEWAAEKGLEYVIEDYNDNVQLNNRTAFGVVFPKRRRIGGTTQAAFFLLMITLRRRFGGFAIQSLTYETALNDVYRKKILPSWKRMWFFFKPAQSVNDAKSLIFTPARGDLLSKGVEPHGGWLVPRSSENKAFDGNEITAYLNDESGKKEGSNILAEFLDTIKNTLAYGEEIHGFAIYVSTLGKIDEGGREFFEMCKRSFSDDRNDSGQTQTGLVTMFISAAEGFDGCIDMYGESIIDDPDDPYITLDGKTETEGSMTKIMNHRKFLQRRKNWAGLNTYIRNNPLNLREASKKVSGGKNWNVEALSTRISDLNFDVPATRRVSLYWSDGLTIRGGRKFREGLSVIIKDDPDGVFNISLSPSESTNSKILYDPVGEYWMPDPKISNRFVLGVDPFKSDESDASSKTKFLSFGAGVLKWKRDVIIDPDDKDMRDWQSNRIVLDYLHRPETTDEFCEDMLMAAVLFGAMASIERNIDIVIKTWKRWKFGGYIMYLYNTVTEKFETAPGYHASPATHQTGISLIQNHLTHHINREVHVKVLEQVDNVEGVSDITRNDLFAAWEAAEIGCANTIPDGLSNHAEHQIGMEGMFPLFSY